MDKMILRPLTYQHFSAAKAMPRKTTILRGVTAKRWLAAIKRERKMIARYYRYVRANPDYGRASVAHRYRVVTNGAQAKVRLKNLGVL